MKARAQHTPNLDRYLMHVYTDDILYKFSCSFTVILSPPPPPHHPPHYPHQYILRCYSQSLCTSSSLLSTPITFHCHSCHPGPHHHSFSPPTTSHCHSCHPRPHHHSFHPPSPLITPVTPPPLPPQPNCGKTYALSSSL